MEQRERYMFSEVLAVLKEIIKDGELFVFHRPSFVIGYKHLTVDLDGEIVYHQLVRLPEEHQRRVRGLLTTQPCHPLVWAGKGGPLGEPGEEPSHPNPSWELRGGEKTSTHPGPSPSALEA
jgi:hypothetical protein